MNVIKRMMRKYQVKQKIDIFDIRKIAKYRNSIDIYRPSLLPRLTTRYCIPCATLDL